MAKRKTIYRISLILSMRLDHFPSTRDYALENFQSPSLVGSSLYLVFKLAARIDSRLESPHDNVQWQVLMRQGEIHSGRTRPNQTTPNWGPWSFLERALDYSDVVDQETLVDIFLYGMANEYRVYLEKLIFSSFSKLMKVARITNESVRRPPKTTIANRSGIIPRPFLKKGQW